MALSNKQKVFVLEYTKTWNAAEAARRAGYSVHTAREIGKENLTKPYIKEEIARCMADLQMSADEVLVRLTEQARGSMADFVDMDMFSINLSKAEKAGKLHLLKKLSHTISTTSDTETVTIELYDAQDALALLARRHKLLVDRLEATGADGAPLITISSIEAVKPSAVDSGQDGT